MIVSRTELVTIASKSLVDCHVIGMDSVMLDDTPGRRVRAYITRLRATGMLKAFHVKCGVGRIIPAH